MIPLYAAEKIKREVLCNSNKQYSRKGSFVRVISEGGKILMPTQQSDHDIILRMTIKIFIKLIITYELIF